MRGLVKHNKKSFCEKLKKRCEEEKCEDVLFYASLEGDLYEIERLNELGFKVWNKGLFGACVSGNKKLAELMIEKGAKNFAEAQFFCYFSGNKEVIELIQNKSKYILNRALDGACYAGNIELVKELIEIKNSEKNKKYKSFEYSVESDNVQLVEMMFQYMKCENKIVTFLKGSLKLSKKTKKSKELIEFLKQKVILLNGGKIKKNKNEKTIISRNTPLSLFIENSLPQIEKKISNFSLSLFSSTKNRQQKELTENFAPAFHLIQFLNSLENEEKYSVNNEKILCINVGDGKNPKSAIVFSALTRWKVLSVDPLMEENWINQIEFDNLKCISSFVEGLIFDQICSQIVDLIIIVGVHCHADLNSFFHKISSSLHLPTLLYSIPCCIPEFQNLDFPPRLDFKDQGIISKKNQVFIWAKGL